MADDLELPIERTIIRGPAVDALANRKEQGIPPEMEFSPVWRMVKGYANQHKNGAHMVDLIDSANGHMIASCIYEPYADQILDALRMADRPQRRG